MNRAVLLAAIASLVSCQGGEGDASVKTFAGDELSLAPPPGWELKRQKDTLVFVAPSAEDGARSTIAVRSVPKEAWSEPRTADTVRRLSTVSSAPSPARR